MDSFKKIAKSWWFPWLMIGLALRLILMPFTVHPDIRAFDLGAYLISQKGELLTFYDHLAHLSPDNPLLKNFPADFFIYPPLSYLVPAAFMAVLAPLYNFPFNDVFLQSMEMAYQKIEFYQTLFLLKFPYLFFDFLLVYLLCRIFSGEKGKLAFKFWMINPITLYTTFAIGQIDIFPTLLVVAALFSVVRNKKELSVLMLGIGGAFKLFPLLLIPIFVLVLKRKFWQRVKLLIIGLVPYLLIILPYGMISPMYRYSAFLAVQTQKMLYMKLFLSGAEYISIFAFGYFSLLLLADKFTDRKEILWKLSLALMLLFFSVTHYHPQWFLWITPFIIWDLVVNGKKHLFYITGLMICYSMIVLFFEPSLHLGLFAPVFPSLLKLTTLTDIVSRFYDVFLIKSLIRTLFAVCAFFFAWHLFAEEKKINLKP